MTANSTSASTDIGLDGTLVLVGHFKGIATVQMTNHGAENNQLLEEKIVESFHGSCVYTETLTKAPCFIFTVNAGISLDNHMWFLRMVRSKLNEVIKAINLSSKMSS